MSWLSPPGDHFIKMSSLKKKTFRHCPFRRSLSTKGSSAETTEEIHILRRSVSNRPEHSIESPLENGLLAGHRLPSLGHWKKRVAEKPEKLVVYDGTGAGQGVWMRGTRSAARDW